MQCPKCRTEMKENDYKGVKYDQCKGCGGLWFGALEAEELSEIKGAASLDTGDVKTGKEMNQHRKINCPVCSVAMSKDRDVLQPHIELETCNVCKGMFFDAGEFKDFSQETFMDGVKDWIAKRQAI